MLRNTSNVECQRCWWPVAQGTVCTEPWRTHKTLCALSGDEAEQRIVKQSDGWSSGTTNVQAERWITGSVICWRYTHQLYSPAPAGMPIRLGRSGGSVKKTGAGSLRWLIKSPPCCHSIGSIWFLNLLIVSAQTVGWLKSPSSSPSYRPTLYMLASYRLSDN